MIQQKKNLCRPTKKRRHSRISSTWYSIHVTVKLACSVKVIRIYSREETSLLSLALTTKSRRETIRTSNLGRQLHAAIFIGGQRPSWIISKPNLPKYLACRMFQFFFFFWNKILLFYNRVTHNPFFVIAK